MRALWLVVGLVLLCGCGAPAATVTPVPTATATPPPALTPQRVIQGFRDAGLRVETDPRNNGIGCVEQPGYIAGQVFGTDLSTTSANVVAEYDTIDHAEAARAACTGRAFIGLRRERIVLAMVNTGTAQGRYLPYFTVLQSLR